MVSTKENELSDLAAIALDVYIETNKNKQNQGKNEQKREIKKRYKTEVFDNNYSSGLKYAVYVNQNKPNEVILAFAGTDFFSKRKEERNKDIENDIDMFMKKVPEQFYDAICVYADTKKKHLNANITITGHSLGGSLAQLVGAVSREKTVAFNPYGTKQILDNLKEYKIIPHSDYSNITNYKTSNDLIFNAFELGNCNKNPGKTYIVEDNMGPINSHSNFDAITKGTPIPAEKYIETHSYSTQIKKFKEEQKQKIMANFNSFVKYDIKDHFIQGFDGEKKDDRSPSQKTADEINNDKWDSNDISFLEGFHSKDKDNHLIKEAKFRRVKRSETRQGERLTERLKPFRFQKQSSKLVSR